MCIYALRVCGVECYGWGVRRLQEEEGNAEKGV